MLNGISKGIITTINDDTTTIGTTIGTTTDEGSFGSYSYSGFLDCTTEVYLTDGNKAVLDIKWNSIKSIVEKTKKSISFSLKFPFITIIERPYIQLTLSSGAGLDQVYNIDCNINGFMRLIDRKYRKFTEHALLGSLEG